MFYEEASLPFSLTYLREVFLPIVIFCKLKSYQKPCFH
jgi:hypothetical protein